MVERATNELRAHPIYIELRLSVSPAQLAVVRSLGEIAFQEPILISREGIIIDGHARKSYAECIGRATVPCTELDIDAHDAIRLMLSKHRGSKGWNQYNRIRLASRLKDTYRRDARANQQAGGRSKGSSKLTQASVRKRIAGDAGVCEANVTKVDQLQNAHPKLLAALANGEIRIHTAWCWRELSSEGQIEELRKRRLEVGLKRTARALALGRNSSRNDRLFLTAAKAKELLQGLSWPPSETASEDLIEVVRINIPGKAVVITQELYDTLWNDRSVTQSAN